MLDKKQIWAIFLFKFKMGCKAAETTCNISNTLGPGTANECRVQWLFKKLHKEYKSPRDKHSGQPTEVDNDQLRTITKADPLTTPQEVAKENVDHSMIICHLKQIGKVKKFRKVSAPWADHKSK